MFVTCLVIMVDLTTAHAVRRRRHNLPYLGATVSFAGAGSRMPLGLMSGSEYEEDEVVIEPGDLLSLERRNHRGARRQRADFGIGRTRHFMEALRRRGPGRPMCPQRSPRSSGSMEQEDDMTLVALEYRTRQGAAAAGDVTVCRRGRQRARGDAQVMAAAEPPLVGPGSTRSVPRSRRRPSTPSNTPDEEDQRCRSTSRLHVARSSSRVDLDTGSGPMVEAATQTST